MKKQFLVIGVLLLVCSMAMCVNQTQIPDNFIQSYGKIETTQKEIETIYLAYENQVDKRIEYVQNNESNASVDSKHLLSLLESEMLLINQLEQKSAAYSTQINELFNASKDIKNEDTKSKVNDLVLMLRNSQQYLSRGALDLKEGTQFTGEAVYYYATGADITDPLIQQEIQGLNLNARTSFDAAVQDLSYYYNLTKDSNALYQELIK